MAAGAFNLFSSPFITIQAYRVNKPAAAGSVLQKLSPKVPGDFLGGLPGLLVVSVPMKDENMRNQRIAKASIRNEILGEGTK